MFIERSSFIFSVQNNEMQHTNLQNMGLTNHEVDSSHEFVPMNRQKREKREKNPELCWTLGFSSHG